MYPVEKKILDNVLQRLEIPNITSATIRQIVAVSQELEKEAGERCVHLELGNPGLPAEEIGLNAECGENIFSSNPNFSVSHFYFVFEFFVYIR